MMVSIVQIQWSCNICAGKQKDTAARVGGFWQDEVLSKTQHGVAGCLNMVRFGSID